MFTEALLSAVARSGAIKHWRSMGADTPADAVGPLAWLLRRRWAFTALRANARLLLDRLEMVGAGATRAQSRRSTAAGRASVWALRDARWAMHGPRVRREQCWR